MRPLGWEARRCLGSWGPVAADTVAILLLPTEEDKDVDLDRNLCLVGLAEESSDSIDLPVE